MSGIRPYIIDAEGNDVELRSVLISESDASAIERAGDASMRAGEYQTALNAYSVALRLRSESGFHPLRRAEDSKT